MGPGVSCSGWCRGFGLVLISTLRPTPVLPLFLPCTFVVSSIGHACSHAEADAGSHPCTHPCPDSGTHARADGRGARWLRRTRRWYVHDGVCPWVSFYEICFLSLPLDYPTCSLAFLSSVLAPLLPSHRCRCCCPRCSLRLLSLARIACNADVGVSVTQGIAIAAGVPLMALLVCCCCGFCIASKKKERKVGTRFTVSRFGTAPEVKPYPATP